MFVNFTTLFPFSLSVSCAAVCRNMCGIYCCGFSCGFSEVIFASSSFAVQKVQMRQTHVNKNKHLYSFVWQMVTDVVEHKCYATRVLQGQSSLVTVLETMIKS